MNTTRFCRKCGTEPLGKHRQVCDACNALRHRVRYGKLKAKFGGLYWVWNSMNQRCTNSNDEFYHRYGGRGISVCDEWRSSFAAFYAWATTTGGYRPGLQIDREDNDGNYGPDNCRFVTSAINIRNRSISKFTETQVGTIKRRLIAGESEVTLASEFKCSRSSIRGIQRGRRWGDVQPETLHAEKGPLQ